MVAAPDLGSGTERRVGSSPTEGTNKSIMSINFLDIVNEHVAIRKTIGYEALDKVSIVDMDQVIKFLIIATNYINMQEALGNENSNKGEYLAP